MIDLRWVPLDKWPHAPCTERLGSPFRATWPQTLDLLERELKHLRAIDAVMQAFYKRDQISNAGWPKAGAKPSGPGVILSFESNGKPLSFPCDRYTQVMTNVRAIALALEALRAVDRYGVTRHAEQYQGWLRIEAAPLAGFRSIDDAAMFIATQADAEADEDAALCIVNDPEWRREAYRRAAKRLHPDRGGSQELFVKLQQALAMLEA